MRFWNAVREIVWLSWIALGLVIAALAVVLAGGPVDVALILVLAAIVFALLRS